MMMVTWNILAAARRACCHTGSLLACDFNYVVFLSDIQATYQRDGGDGARPNTCAIVDTLTEWATSSLNTSTDLTALGDRARTKIIGRRQISFTTGAVDLKTTAALPLPLET